MFSGASAGIWIRLWVDMSSSFLRVPVDWRKDKYKNTYTEKTLSLSDLVWGGYDADMTLVTWANTSERRITPPLWGWAVSFSFFFFLGNPETNGFFLYIYAQCLNLIESKGRWRFSFIDPLRAKSSLIGSVSGQGSIKQHFEFAFMTQIKSR